MTEQRASYHSWLVFPEREDSTTTFTCRDLDGVQDLLVHRPWDEARIVANYGQQFEVESYTLTLRTRVK